ncbi:hypothetical protein GCM10011341_16560 [Frigidibacter albus]|nr:hypothetical protein GCM10011341_16560 [Frigidibacter albus]
MPLATRDRMRPAPDLAGEKRPPEGDERTETFQWKVSAKNARPRNAQLGPGREGGRWPGPLGPVRCGLIRRFVAKAMAFAKGSYAGARDFGRRPSGTVDS